MTTSIQAPIAQKRNRRTRTKNVSSRPALVVSTLPPTHYDLLPGTEHLACPDCQTWCPITGAQGEQPKLVPHHTQMAGTPGARRCIGSNRLVVIDVTIAEQQQDWADAVAETASRRPTRVLKKVKAPQAPAIVQIAQPRPAAPAPTAAERAEQWAARLLPVFIADAQRRIALIDTPGDVQGPIRGIEAPTKTLHPAA
ncbi:hypothetical protein ACIRRH_35705 [Kitasatospora sp. NPDC101235]|uniref:hypothetical protein n=1 Tax=Kitasatospora sp. NPDC101235 TaxID=3364101 RepID=UPI0037F694C4